MINERRTKYTQAVKDYLALEGHATNLQILNELHLSYMELSATTIHRITTRLVDRGELSIGPSAMDHSQRFDINLKPHDHFHCTQCDRLRDVVLSAETFKSIQNSVVDCKLNGRLTIQGICNKCINNKEKL